MSPAGRADARRNRERILDAADEIFGSGASEASTERVAAQASVGIGTVFRHFPTKKALLEAVLIRRLSRLRDDADALLRSSDPGDAFFTFFRTTVEDAATKIPIADALLAGGMDMDPSVRLAAEEMLEAFGQLLNRAQRAGAIREDVELPEVYALLTGISRASLVSRPETVTIDRLLRIVFSGLSPTN